MSPQLRPPSSDFSVSNCRIPILDPTMALFEVSGFPSYPDLRAQIVPGQTHLVDRTSHFSFGIKTQEFAVPLGADVSIILRQFNSKTVYYGKCIRIISSARTYASDASWLFGFYASVIRRRCTQMSEMCHCPRLTSHRQ